MRDIRKIILFIISFIFILIVGVPKSIAVVKSSTLAQTTPVTYRLDLKGKTVTTSYTGAFAKNTSEKRVYYKLPNKSKGSYTINDTLTVIYKDAATNVNGEKFNVRVKILNVKLVDYRYTDEDGSGRYFWVYDWSQGMSIGMWGTYSSAKEDENNYRSIFHYLKGIKYDVTIEIVDSNGNAQNGTYVFSAYDIDIANHYKKSNEWVDEFNSRSEGINFTKPNTFNLDTLQVLNNSILKIEKNSDGVVTRIRGTKADDESEKSGFSVIAKAKKTQFTWTGGRTCATIFNSSYHPQIVKINKKDDTSGEKSVINANLKIYRGTTEVESWMTDENSKSFLLQPGTYTLKENQTPKGYNSASNIEFTIDKTGKITANNQKVSSIVMTDSIKDALVIVHHYLINENGKTTTKKAPSKTGGECEDEIIKTKYFEEYSTKKAEVPDEYEYVRTVGNPSGIVNDDEVIVIYYYRLKNYPYVIHYIDKESGIEISPSKNDDKPYGTRIIAKEEIIDISGYKYDSSDKIDILIGKDKNEINIYYNKIYELEIDDDGHHEWYLRGYEDYTFRINNNVTREEVATIFYRLTKTANGDMRQNYVVRTKPYEDVEIDRWSARPIAYMKELGIMKGYTDGSFMPTKPITRAEFAQVIMRYIATPKKNENMFSDLSENHWASDAILMAANEGWIQGYNDGTFRPDVNITRVETVTIVNRMLNRCISRDIVNDIWIPIVDLDPNHWGYADVLEAITSHDYTKNENGKENWTNYRYPFHGDMSEEAYNDV